MVVAPCPIPLSFRSARDVSGVKRSKRIINAANLKRCKSESRIASRSVCAFPVSGNPLTPPRSPPFVDREGEERNLEGEVIKPEGDFVGTNFQSFAIHRGSRFPFEEIQNSKNRCSESWSVATSLSLSLSPVINRVFTPNSYPKGDFLSFNTACVCVIPSTYLFCSLLFLFARFTSFRSNSKGGGFLIRVSFDKYFKFIVIISYPSIEPRETETLRGLNEICKQSYSEGKHVWRT